LSDTAIKIENLSKCYQIYDQPRDRLKQFVLPRVQRVLGLPPRQYFREFWALKDVSLEINKGEIVGIIGRNGSGKSTLLQLACGTLNPTSGDIRTNGRIAALLELGSGFNPEFTGRENVHMNAAILGLSKEETERRFDEIAAFADIGDFIDQAVKTYSSGMVVRLAFAVASCVDPEILIVDEALAVGDANFQAKCFRRFRTLQERGVTVLLVTHDISAVVQLCNRAFVLHKGRIVASGSPKEMSDEYRRRCAEEVNARVGNSTMEGVSSSQESCLEKWMARLPDAQVYGNGCATIEQFALLDEAGNLVQKIASGAKIVLRMKICFHEACEAPIAAFGFRNLAGQDLCGTNSWYENSEIGPVKAGDIVTVEYRFHLPLQTGSYHLCIACTEIAHAGLMVHCRLYDVMVLEVVADRRFTGYFDLMARISIYRQEGIVNAQG
jgi:lipopolysaccharide transport system ATP-binding protein